MLPLDMAHYVFPLGVYFFFFFSFLPNAQKFLGMTTLARGIIDTLFRSFMLANWIMQLEHVT